MENGTLVRWCKQEGDFFDIGEELYEIETEKAVVPIHATRQGRVVRTLATAGDTIAVGALLAIAAERGEEASPDQIDSLLKGGARNDSAVEAPAASPTPPAGASNAPAAIAAVPKARALAKELGVDLSLVQGSGVGGAIMPDDVRRAADAARQRADAAAGDPRITRRAPLSPIGRSIVAALEKAAGIPQFTQGILVDATELVRQKAAANTFTYMDYFLDALVRAGREVPDVFARVSEREMQYFGCIDISIAAATEHGLLLAVLKDAGSMTASERSRAWRALVERARLGRLSPLETTGGMVALSNLGARGVDYGTPLLPAGHSAIAFFGSIEKRAVVIGDALEARPTVHVSITYDHRVVDGVQGARFTTAVRRALESPALGP